MRKQNSKTGRPRKVIRQGKAKVTFSEKNVTAHAGMALVAHAMEAFGLRRRFTDIFRDLEILPLANGDTDVTAFWGGAKSCSRYQKHAIHPQKLELMIPNVFLPFIFTDSLEEFSSFKETKLSKNITSVT